MALINQFQPVQTVVKRRKLSRQTATLRYPTNLGSHAVILNFKRYDYGSTQSGRASIDNTRSIVLPLPNNLVDTFSVNVASQELGLTGQTVADAVSRGAFESGRNLTQSAAESVTNLINSLGEGDSKQAFEQGVSNWKIAGGFFSRAGIDAISPAVGTGIDVATGNTVNPHVTLNFDGMNLKTHTFSWSFAPESPEDSEQLRKVNNAIKRAQLPSYKNVSGSLSPERSFADRALLTYPDLVDIFFVGIDQRYFYYFKPCMIQNFTTDFSPEGLAFVQGGKPAVVNMSLQLSEARIHTREDYYDDGFVGGGGR